MKRIEHLINDIKFSTNEQSNRFSDIRFNKLFNDAQKEIQNIIQLSSSDNKFFQSENFQNIISGQSDYNLPSDIYAINTISSVHVGDYSLFGEWPKLRYKYDYDIINGVIRLLHEPKSYGILKIKYTKKLSTLGNRVGKIQTIASPLITMTEFDSSLDITDFDDYFTIVDRDGLILDNNMIIDSYVKATGVISTSSTITAPTGSYIVLGKNSTTHSELPESCETYLTMYVEKMVNHINSNGTDLANSSVFSNEERSDIQELFSKNEGDVKSPEIIDYDFLDYNSRY